MKLFLWQRYFFLETLRSFFFFLLSFFFLYSLLDYSTHMDDFFKESHIQIGDIFSFYFHHFLKRADLLLPLALLVATIKVVTSLNMKREWMALQVSGISSKKLSMPFFILAALCALFNWVNFQTLLPPALNKLDEFHATHFKSSHRAQREEQIHLFTLKDRSKLFYHTYDKEKDAFFDVLWIRSLDDIWRIKYLHANPLKPEGKFVDHLVRNKEGFLEKEKSYPTLLLSDLKWNPKMGGKSFLPFENRSIKELYKLGFFTSTTTPYEKPKILTQLFFKCAIPLLSPLVVLAILPYCTLFSRYFSPFFLYAIGLFGTLAFYMILDSAVILGENRAFSPFLVIVTPFMVCGGIFLGRFWKKI